MGLRFGERIKKNDTSRLIARPRRTRKGKPPPNSFVWLGIRGAERGGIDD
jgi:hypothetical protein